MNLSDPFRFKIRNSLNNISSSVYFNLSQNQFAKVCRKKMLEELFLCNPDNITKEIIYNFYFRFDIVVGLIDDMFQMILKDYLISMLLKKKCKYINKRGRLTSRGQKIIFSEFDFLPAPFLKRLRSRLGFIQIDTENLQEDYIKLSRILDILKEKGYLISKQSKHYYHSIDLNNLLEEYTNHKFNENYLQLILEKLKVLSISYDKKREKTDKIVPIEKEKKISQLKKNLTNYMNLCITSLEPFDKKDFVNIIVENNFNEIEGKKLIFKLSFLLKDIDYGKAKNQIISEFEQIKAEKEKLGKMEIDTKGLYYRYKGSKEYIFRKLKE